ncbi:MAG: TolC family protein, partial [Balneolaceae bacterium]
VIHANAAYRQAEWDIAETVLRVKEMAENAWHSYETSRETIHSYRNFIQRRSENLLELTQEGYRMGELDLLRVLEAQRTYLEGQQQYYQALRNYYLKLIELEQYMPYEIVFNQ